MHSSADRHATPSVWLTAARAATPTSWRPRPAVGRHAVPDFYYLTCPRAASAIGTLEAGGVMREMTQRLAEDADLAGATAAAHEAYLADRRGTATSPRSRASPPAVCRTG